MSFTLLYHPLVNEEDIPRLDRRLKKRISDAVFARLSSHPETYGKPLRGSLAGYWKLRVGDYRAVYRVVGTEVWVFGVLNRRDVYEAIVRRFGWKP